MTDTSLDLDPLRSALGRWGEVVRTRTAAERVADVLKARIIDGALLSGTRLTEETIGAALGVSRNTVREAYALLSAEQLVVREANRGVFVRTLDADDVLDLYRTRRAIEPAALEHGPHLDADLVSRLRAAVEEGLAARASGDRQGVALANQHFHAAVVEASGSLRLAALMTRVLAEMRLVFRRMGDATAFHEPYLDRNAAICSLVEEGDRVGAARHLEAYLDDARDQLLAHLGSLPSSATVAPVDTLTSGGRS